MDRKHKQAIIATGIAFVIILAVITAAIIKNLTPSKERMELTEYYEVDNGNVLVIMQDHIYEKSGLYEDNTIYMDYDTVVQLFNKRMYWDANENILI